MNDKKSKLIILIFFAFLAGAIFMFRNNFAGIYSRLFLRMAKIEKDISDLTIQKIQKQINLPEPLKIFEKNHNSFLTKIGVIEQTNLQREKNGFSRLKENFKLDASATAKSEDMLKNQYFAHESPSRKKVSDLAIEEGYDFLVIGENLALGDFKDDQALVQAWMDSPGHRANILNSKYEEIGVAVIKGEYEGQETWLAVQHFGRPSSDCIKPEENLRLAVEESHSQLEKIRVNLSLLESDIQNKKYNSKEEYNQKIQTYNNLVNQYNSFVKKLKELTSEYNLEVKQFNACVAG